MFPRTAPPTPETRGAPLHTADTSQHHYAQRQALLRSVLSRPLHHAASVSSFTSLVLRQAPQLLTGPSLQPSLTLTTAPCALGQNRHFLVPHTGLSLGPPPRSCGHLLSELCQKGPSVRPDPGHRHRPGGDPQPPSAGSPTRALARARGPTSRWSPLRSPQGDSPSSHRILSVFLSTQSSTVSVFSLTLRLNIFQEDHITSVSFAVSGVLVWLSSSGDAYEGKEKQLCVRRCRKR